MRFLLPLTFPPVIPSRDAPDVVVCVETCGSSAAGRFLILIFIPRGTRLAVVVVASEGPPSEAVGVAPERGPRLPVTGSPRSS